MFSKKVKYGLKAAIYLARYHEQGPIIISDLSLQEYIPRKFLEKILLQLKNNDVLKSQMGRKGGYLLSRSPQKIFLGEIIRILDGPIAPVPCVSKINYQRCYDCQDEKICEVRKVMKLVRDATVQILDHTSLDDALHSSFPMMQIA